MTPWQITQKIKFPLALSVIMGRLRNALVVAVGVTAIVTFVGSGGLGDIITRGVQATDGAVIVLAGAIPIALLAGIFDITLGWIETKLDSTK